MSNLQRRIEKGLCSGCGLCTDSPDAMAINENGYLRPAFPIEDQITTQCCPAIRVGNFSKGYKYDSIWGPIVDCQKGHANDISVRQLGSSGGVLTQLAIFLLERHEVDAIIHIGADLTSPTLNQVVISSNRDEVIRNAGSRYAPSAPLSIIRNLLGNGQRYAVIAKPCDIAAMRALISINSAAATQFKYLLSFFCAGIPSQHATAEILKQFQVNESEINSFRYRGNGWPGRTTAELKDGSERSMTYNEAWGKILNQHLQTRCKLCPDGIGEAADIVCADAWEESEGGYPSFEERDGLSLVLCRTKTGMELKSNAQRENKISTYEFDISILRRIQPYQLTRKATSFARNLAFYLCRSVGLRSSGLGLTLAMRSASLLTQSKTFLGSIKRFAQKFNDA